MLNLTQIKRKINYHFLEEEKEVNLNKLPKKKVMVLNFDNHIQFSVFLTKPLFNLKIFIYVNIISHLNISSKKIVFIIKIYYACLEYCNNLIGVYEVQINVESQSGLPLQPNHQRGQRTSNHIYTKRFKKIILSSPYLKSK